jgi:hypothetical protein
MNNNRDADARQLAQRLLEKAASQEEAQTARDLLEQINRHQQWVAQRKAQTEAAASPASKTVIASAPASEPVSTSATAKPVDTRLLLAVEAPVKEIDCAHKPEVTLTLRGGNRPLIFHAADLQAVGITGKGQDIPNLDSCEKWKGRRIRIWFVMAKGKSYMGEITDIAFE